MKGTRTTYNYSKLKLVDFHNLCLAPPKRKGIWNKEIPCIDEGKSGDRLAEKKGGSSQINL